MKKILFTASCLILVTALLLAVCGLGVASESDWKVIFKAYGTNPNTGTLCSVGTKPGANDYPYPNPVTIQYSVPYPNSVYIAAYDPTYPGLYSTYLKAPIVAGQTKEWNMVMWASPGYTGSVANLSWFTGAIYAPPATIGGVPYEYAIEIIYDPTGMYAPGTRFNYPAGASGTSSQPVGAIPFNMINVIKVSDAEAMMSGVKLKLIARPVPEPSSFVALAMTLGGFAFKFRRRK